MPGRMVLFKEYVEASSSFSSMLYNLVKVTKTFVLFISHILQTTVLQTAVMLTFLTLIYKLTVYSR